MNRFGQDGKFISPDLVFSPSLYLPAVIAKAEALAVFAFGSAEVLGVRRLITDMGWLGVDADVLGIDGTPGGVLRSLLLTRASEQVFTLLSTKDRRIDLGPVTDYYRGPGARAIRGQIADVLTPESANYDWCQ